MSDERPASSPVLDDVLERALEAADTGSLPDLLTGVAAELLIALSCTQAGILVWAADGRPEVSITAGDGVGLDDATVLSAPLQLDGRPVGVLRVAGAEHDATLASREPAVRAAAATIAAVVGRAAAADATRRRDRWLSGGTEIARALTTTHHPDPLAMIAERAREIASADGVVIFGPGAVPGLLRVEATAGASVAAAQQHSSCHGRSEERRDS